MQEIFELEDQMLEMVSGGCGTNDNGHNNTNCSGGNAEHFPKEPSGTSTPSKPPREGGGKNK